MAFIPIRLNSATCASTSGNAMHPQLTRYCEKCYRPPVRRHGDRLYFMQLSMKILESRTRHPAIVPIVLIVMLSYAMRTCQDRPNPRKLAKLCQRLPWKPVKATTLQYIIAGKLPSWSDHRASVRRWVRRAPWWAHLCGSCLVMFDGHDVVHPCNRDQVKFR